MNGVGGYHGWRWIFIIEGIPTMIMGVVTFFFMANDSDSAYFFTEEDRVLIQLRRDGEYGQTASAQLFNKKDALKAFTDWKVWGMASGQFAINVMLYGKYHHGLLNLLVLTLHLQATRHSFPQSSKASRPGPPRKFNFLPSLAMPLAQSAT